MRKLLLLPFLLIPLAVHAQSQIARDSIVRELNAYLPNNIHYSESDNKANVEGTAAVTIEINTEQIIENIKVKRHLSDDFDKQLVVAVQSYSKRLPLTPGTYTIVLLSYLLEDGKPDSPVISVDPSRYQNFLLEIVVTADYKSAKRTFTYY